MLYILEHWYCERKTGQVMFERKIKSTKNILKKKGSFSGQLHPIYGDWFLKWERPEVFTGLLLGQGFPTSLPLCHSGYR